MVKLKLKQYYNAINIHLDNYEYMINDKELS